MHNLDYDYKEVVTLCTRHPGTPTFYSITEYKSWRAHPTETYKNYSCLHGGQRGQMPQTCFVLSPMTAVRHADISLSVHVQGHVTDLAGPLGSLETEKKIPVYGISQLPK